MIAGLLRWAAILAAAANEPKLLEPIKKYYSERLSQFEKTGLNFEDVSIVILATSGLNMFEQLRMSPFSAKQRKLIINKLMGLIDHSA